MKSNEVDVLVKKLLMESGVDPKALFRAANQYSIERSLYDVPVLVVRIPLWTSMPQESDVPSPKPDQGGQ
jgi:hypothetical protein